MMGCVRQGDWETSLATLRQLATARRWEAAWYCSMGAVHFMAILTCTLYSCFLSAVMAVAAALVQMILHTVLKLRFFMARCLLIRGLCWLQGTELPSHQPQQGKGSTAQAALQADECHGGCMMSCRSRCKAAYQIDGERAVRAEVDPGALLPDD